MEVDVKEIELDAKHSLEQDKKHGTEYTLMHLHRLAQKINELRTEMTLLQIEYGVYWRALKEPK